MDVHFCFLMLHIYNYLRNYTFHTSELIRAVRRPKVALWTVAVQNAVI